MSIWAKIVLSGIVLAVLVAGLAFWMDLYGIRRGCFASRLDQVSYESARALYEQANRAIASKNYSVANDMLGLALTRLGDSYQLGRAEDDTSEAVTAAKAASARAEFEVAARIKSEVMSRRLALLQRKMRLSEICHAAARNWGLG